MRPVLYFVTTLVASGSAMGSAIPNGAEVNKRQGPFECRPSLCKNPDRTDCFPIDASPGTCINLVSSDGRPFVSAASAGTCNCVAYSNRDCPIFGGENYGFSVPTTFSFHANSIECSIPI
ncbi:hypothetical protein AJ79_06193 [Helicocarpus griseus UAMH5409]|uniref:Uncharacterized protein n=1 Tax=Helicocarpus griseus UAMH5409 TaxID=1447875 RepID=A0A2B7XEZ0_9EURO|nr:hypothetical protein AJ79_06193 [Helicocarpus griseus UAMH5409]